VRAPTASSDVALIARWERRVLAKKAGIDLAAGEVLRVSLKLRQRVAAALERRETARITLTATVPGGSPDVFQRTLR
jgi:hypothetical protein